MKQLFLLLLLLLCMSDGHAASDGPAYVRVAHGSKIASIEIVGHLFNGSVEPAQAGSGLRVSQYHILTSGHLFASVGNFKSIEITVRLGSRKAKPIAATLVLRDPVSDLALLKLSDVSEEPGCPFFLVNDTRAIPTGTDLYFLGFPINGPLRISPGILSTDPDAESDLWQTNAPLNPGDSGAPVFTRFGYFAGIAKGVLSEWHTGGQVIPIAGISQFVPAPRIAASKVGQILLNELADERCLRSVAMNLDGSFGLSGGAPAPVELPSAFTVAHSISVGWDANEAPAPQKRYFNASPGYVIDRCAFEEIRKDRTSLHCEIASDGKLATVEFVPEAQRKAPTLVAVRVLLTQQPLP